MARVVWTDQALADVEGVAAYVAAFNPLAAPRLGLRLLSAGDGLETSPKRGRPISRGRRELTVVPPYLIRYRVDTDQVLILEVRHGVRRPDGR